MIQAEQKAEMELIFSPTEVASYDFELPMFVNKPNENLFVFEQNNNGSPVPSEFMSSTRGKSPVAKSSRTSLVNFVPKRRINAIGLRPALQLSDLKLYFKIPIMYLEKLKEGGFYEAKSIVMTNHSHRPVKWCIDMRKSNKVLEDGIVFKICNGSMAPFVTNGDKNNGPEGEIKPNESYELKVLFCPS